MSELPDLGRRSLFGMAAASVLSGETLGLQKVRLDRAMATDRMVLGQPEESMRGAGLGLTVAGPQDGDLAGLARHLSGPLAAGLMTGSLALRYGGGSDGVTQSNQFDARMMPDGQHALLLPGDVALSWLAGDGRVRLDPAHMLPLLAAYGPGLLMVRGALPTPAHGGRLRLATGPGADASLTAMLGLDLLGIGVTRVAMAGAPDAAALRGQADAVFLHGAGWRAKAPALLQAGFAPAFSSALDDRETLWPALQAPSFQSALATTKHGQSPLLAAWRALAMASSVCAVLVLPRISPAEAIGRWRRAAGACLADRTLLAQAHDQGIQLAAGNDADAALSPMCSDGTAVLALRRWIGLRLPPRSG